MDSDPENARNIKALPPSPKPPDHPPQFLFIRYSGSK